MGRVSLLAVVYFVAAKLSLLLAISPGYATAVWPPSGIALAAILLLGRGIWPGIWIGAALVNFTVESSPLAAALIATGNTLEGLVGAALIQRYLGVPYRFERGEDVVRFVAFSALSATIAATVALVPLAFRHALSWPEIISNWWTWWQGDAAGIIIVTPLILCWSTRGAVVWSWQKAAEGVCLASLLLIAAYVVFGSDTSAGGQIPLAFAILPFIIWAAFRFGQREVTTAIVAVCAIAIWYTIERRGPFGSAPLNELLLLLLAFVSTVVVTGLVLSAVLGERSRAMDELRRRHGEVESLVHERTRELERTNRALEDDIVARRQAEQELRESEERFRAIVETTQEWIWEIDRQGRCTFNSPFVHALLGYRPEELLGTDRLAYMLVEDRAMVESLLPGLQAKKRGWTNLVLRWLHKDGSSRCLESNSIPLLDAGGNVAGYRGADRDITEHIRQQEKIARLSRIHAVSSGINATIIRVRDRRELFRQVCRIAVEQGEFRMAWIGLADPGATKVRPVAWMGFEEGYLDEVGLSLRNAGEDQGAAGRALRDKKLVVANDIEADPRIVFKAEALLRGYRSLVALPLLVEGEAVAVMVLYAAQPDVFDDQELKLLDDLAADISFALDYIAKAERLDYLSHHDALTGLPNRTLFHERLSEFLRSAALEESKVAVLMIDLERFRNVNDTLGRHAGDELLKLVAQRLGETVQASSGLARIGGDCFAVSIPDVKEEADIAHMVEQRMLNSFLQPLTVTGVELRTPAKLGIAVFPNDGPDADTLIMNAEAALKKAKVSGEKYLFYAPQMHARVAGRLTLENKLRRALEEAQFVLHYQPKVDSKSGGITGLEALIRWQSPEGGLVPPGTFIPVLEETGLILDVGRWVTEKAAADYRELLVKGVQPPRIAVNVSAVQLRQKGFVDEVARAVDRGGDLDLEITESLIMEDIEGAIEKLKLMKEIGVGVALDDFGTGFSSLSYLVRLPIDCLKIDRAFIVNMTNSADNLAIVSAVILLAHSLKLGVVAEGVETAEQANLLRLLNCDEMQGYFFSRPIPLPQIEAMLRDASSQ